MHHELYQRSRDLVTFAKNDHLNPLFFPLFKNHPQTSYIVRLDIVVMCFLYSKTLLLFEMLKAQDILSPDCRRKKTELTINTKRI